LARAEGVKVHDGHGLTAATQDDDAVQLDVEGLGAVRARYAVGADGMWSPLRKHLGLAEAGYLGEWHAFRQYASSVTGSAQDRLWVWFEPDLLPGYAWSFPLPDGRANVGFGILRDGRRTGEMKAQWEDLIQRPHVRDALGPDARIDGTPKAWPIPARVDRAVLAAGRALFVGDAAAATDPMTGEGIAQALDSGIAAGEAILAAGALAPERARHTYATAMARTLIPDHRMAIALQHALRTPLGSRAAVRLAGVSPWTRRNFGRWLFEDEPRAVLLTPRRWHHRFLDRDGAYR